MGDEMGSMVKRGAEKEENQTAKLEGEVQEKVGDKGPTFSTCASEKGGHRDREVEGQS